MRMNNKSTTGKADKTVAQMRVPKLRFPEFRDAGEWEKKPLGEVYSFKVTNSFSRDKLNYEKGLVKNIHYGDIHTKFSTLFDIRKEMVPFINSSEAIGKIKSDSYCIEGDMVFADASEDLNDVGKSIEIVNLNNEKLLSGLHTLLARQKKAKLVIGFGGYLFKSNGIRTGIKKEAQGAKVLGVSAGRLSNINIYFPTDKKEQQKIADCLASTDELIAAQSQKLDTLKAHKKGLMQQLFPAKGETVPKLRFPEFRDAGEWEKKPLGEVYSFKVTNSFSRDKLNYEKGLVKNIHYGDIHTKFSTLFDIRKEMVPFINSSEAIGKIKSDSYCIEGDMVFADASEDLNDVGKSIEIVNLNNEKLLSGLHTLLARQKKAKLVIGFGGYLFKSNGIRTGIKKEAQGAKVLGVSAGRLSNINIYFPTDKKEQQKIADCLASTDELIAAQSQKLDTLKAHKKGLMQQLFPSVDEVNG
jgi:type I restriction enzyme S subunit